MFRQAANSSGAVGTARTRMKVPVVFISICICFATGNDDRISGGELVPINQYPYATALLTNGGEGEYRQACGGTILTASSILSAASCFYTDDVQNPVAWWRARVGSSFSASGGVVHLLNRITQHPEFSTTTRANDLAVLRTTVPITLQVGIVQAAHIAGAAFTLAPNQPVWAVGWGAISASVNASEQLRHVQFWVVDQTTCSNRYSATGFNVTSDMVCVGWLDVGLRGQCQGDNGGPLVESGAVVGVHSWSEDCASGWYPGVNTLVARYTRWIVDAAIAA